MKQRHFSCSCSTIPYKNESRRMRGEEGDKEGMCGRERVRDRVRERAGRLNAGERGQR